MSSTYDWHEIAKAIGSINELSESGGDSEARRALITIVGEENLIGAVDYYVTASQGSELARSVLRMLKPFSAMQRCYEIYTRDSDIEKRRSAVELIRSISDRQAAHWISEFLSDPDTEIQTWGGSMVDQLLWDQSLSAEEATPFLEAMKDHPNPQVKERHSFIEEFLRDRNA
jgi:hypothetical protein